MRFFVFGLEGTEITENLREIRMVFCLSSGAVLPSYFFVCLLFEQSTLISLSQRVSQASVTVEGQTVGAINHGLLILICAERGDTDALVEKMLSKILKLRIFSDEAGKMNRSVQDVVGGLLIVSQFTLAADVSGGNRPSFTNAAPPDEGRKLYELFVEKARAAHAIVQTGQFAANMKVSLINDGPVTIPIRMCA